MKYTGKMCLMRAWSHKKTPDLYALSRKYSFGKTTGVGSLPSLFRVNTNIKIENTNNAKSPRSFGY